MTSAQPLLTLETVIDWARSGRESEKVYRFLFLHPDDFFTVPQRRKWSIAHQVVYNGDISLLKRILALYSDNQITIRKLSDDDKTLLDVAKEQRTVHPNMYNYIENLFLADDLIRAAEQNNWDLVNDILEKHPKLANEKPPYSTYFLLHYLVQNGDTNLLKNLLQTFRFDTNVLSVDLETPLDIAKRLKRSDICAILEPTTRERSDSDRIQYRSPNENSSASASSQLPYPTIDPFPNFEHYMNSLIITDNGDIGIAKSPFSPINKVHIFSPEQQQQQIHSTTEHVDKTNGIDNQNLNINSESTPVTPITPTSKSQLMKHLTCPLIKQIMVDPVIASDGQTYERDAITEYVRRFRCSPMTGVQMDATFKENTELKMLIKLMRKPN